MQRYVMSLFYINRQYGVGIRDFEKMEGIMAGIREDGMASGSVEMLTLDFTSLASVRTFAAEILGRNIPIHFLINAGK